MAAEPEDITLRLLREMRAMMERQSTDLTAVNEQISQLRRQMHEWQETTATAVGFALHANLRHETVQQRLEDLTKRIERLEKQQ